MPEIVVRGCSTLFASTLTVASATLDVNVKVLDVVAGASRFPSAAPFI